MDQAPGPRARPRIWESDRPTIRWGAYAWAITGLLVAFGLIWWGLGHVRIVLFPLVVAIFPAALLTPMARWLEDHSWPPAAAAAAALTSFIVVLAAIGTLVTMQVRSELEGITRQVRSGLQQMQERVPGLPDLDSVLGGSSGGSGGGSSSQGGGSSSQSGGAEGSSSSQSQGGSSSQGAAAAGATDAALAALRGLVRFVTEFLIFLVATFFYVKDGPQIAGFLQRLFPRGRRDSAREIGVRVWRTVGGYIRAQALVAAVDGILFAIGLVIVGVPLALTLGVVVFFGAFIPVVGSIAAGVIAVGVALASKGIVAALITLAILVGVQQLEGNVLAPVVLGRNLGLHPLVVLVVVVAGAALIGPFGALVAVPLAASIHRAVRVVNDHGRPIEQE